MRAYDLNSRLLTGFVVPGMNSFLGSRPQLQARSDWLPSPPQMYATIAPEGPMRWGLTIKEIRTSYLTVLDTYQTFPWIMLFLRMHVLTPYLRPWLSRQRKCNVIDCKSFIVQCLMVFTVGGGGSILLTAA